MAVYNIIVTWHFKAVYSIIVIWHFKAVYSIIVIWQNKLYHERIYMYCTTSGQKQRLTCYEPFDGGENMV